MKLSYVETSKIDPNPNNPRGIDIATKDKNLPFLRDSINNFGVMVPIVVAPRGNRYLLVDGERRYLACKDLGIARIPAFLTAEGLDDKDVLFRMFQIHHNREQWGPIQQCHALEQTYKKIASKPSIKSIQDQSAQISAIAEEMSNLTGIKVETAIDRIKFLRWPKQIKEPLYIEPSEVYWYICEIEDRIVVPAMQNYPEYFDVVPVDDVRQALYDKLQYHSAGISTDVRKVAKVFATPMAREADRKKVKSILSNLHKRREMTYSEAQEEFLRFFPQVLRPEPLTPRKLVSLYQYVETSTQDFLVQDIETAKRRSKATPLEVVSAANALKKALQALIARLQRGVA
jgi:ParB/RepB/Spo0J family partition protein